MKKKKGKQKNKKKKKKKRKGIVYHLPSLILLRYCLRVRLGCWFETCGLKPTSLCLKPTICA